MAVGATGNTCVGNRRWHALGAAPLPANMIEPLAALAEQECDTTVATSLKQGSQEWSNPFMVSNLAN